MPRYNIIDVKSIKVKSHFTKYKQKFSGFILGHKSNVILKLKNIGSYDFEGGSIEISFIFHRRPDVHRSSTSGGRKTISVPKIKRNKSVVVEVEIEEHNPPVDGLDVRVSDVEGDTFGRTRNNGQKLTSVRVLTPEEAENEIRKKIVVSITTGLIIATLGSTLFFGICNVMFENCQIQ